ncbi:MAG: pyrimidine dimer DNA glycosylase/endonuclease V [Acidobacteria bacterium]|nr:pyrimidine dimer DNA glycosylase/endonuclease V [Acidobacteriota bacterium]
MRLWTLHPRYLDTKGLLAAWREGLLAQKVLKGGTRGYRHHPQLARFKASPDPPAAVAAYLRALHQEARRRGYNFDAEKIESRGGGDRVRATRGQLLYEWEHLKRKLDTRDPRRLAELESVSEPDPHPLFEIVEGGVEDWEVLGDD